MTIVVLDAAASTVIDRRTMTKSSSSCNVQHGLFLLILSFLLSCCCLQQPSLFGSNVGVGVGVVKALKHNYYTGRHGDDRTFIGPIGYPFGFLDTGHYNLTVFDFQLAAPSKPHDHDPHNRHGRRRRDLSLLGRNKKNSDTKGSSSNIMSIDALAESIKGVGFLLKKFNNEADFNHYMNWVAANDSRCIFEPYLSRDDDDLGLYQDEYYDDDYEYDYDYEGNGDGTDDFYYDGGYGYDYGGAPVDDEFSHDDLFGPWNPPDDDATRRYTTRRRMASNNMQDMEEEQQQQIERRQPIYGRHLQGVGEVTDYPTVDGIFLDMMPRSRWKPNKPYVVYDFESGEAGLYFLMYQVCFQDGISKNKNQLLDIHSRFELDFHFSNLDFLGKRSFLSAGEMPLPWIFFIFSLVYGALVFVWIYNIILIKEGKSGLFDKDDDDDGTAPPTPVGRGAQLPTGPTVYPIHYMMGILLILKFLSLFFESIRYHYLRVTGHAMFWSGVYYTFAFLKGISLFTVILLIGTGWSFVKPFLADREKKMILAVLALQVVNNIAIVVLTQETEGEKSFDRWTAILHLVDIFCCCAVLIPIVWQVNQLEKNMEQDQHVEDDEEKKGMLSEDDFDDEFITEDEIEGGAAASNISVSRRPPDARLASKLKLFRSFYLIVIAYIYITRIAVYLFAATLNYRHTWVRYFTVEIVTLIFYVTVGKLFRPMNENPYLHLRKGGKRRSNAVKVEMKKIDAKSKSVID
mmetsp:Transcript_54646/g.132712  ORF Transcript_54646/g.132712 Transcript_54646/m.132712 type:complete len:742 (-) Transcript_54646:41-2266(-)